MTCPYDKRIAEVNAELDGLERALLELDKAEGGEAAHRALKAELDWFHEELHQLVAAKEDNGGRE